MFSTSVVSTLRRSIVLLFKFREDCHPTPTSLKIPRRLSTNADVHWNLYQLRIIVNSADFTLKFAHNRQYLVSRRIFGVERKVVTVCLFLDKPNSIRLINISYGAGLMARFVSKWVRNYSKLADFTFSQNGRFENPFSRCALHCE